MLLGWPQGVMIVGAAKAYGAMSAALANYWGADREPAFCSARSCRRFVSVRTDIAKAAGARRPDFSAQERWRKESGLEIAPSSAIVAALTTAAPLFTGPAMDIVSALLKG